MQDTIKFEAIDLPNGIRSRFVNGVNGLNLHILEAGFEDNNGPKRRPCLLLLHGFPELAFSWRKVMVPLAQEGYYVVAPDQRGYGRTTGWNAKYDDDLAPFRFLNLVRDVICLIDAIEYESVAAVIGHDFGSPVAADCALIRPDVFHSVVLMSAPFERSPSIKPADKVDVHGSLADLKRPRKHYQWYYTTRPANDDMTKCPQGVRDFLRAYYHHKSADWRKNKPHPLREWTANELAKMPTYYIMDLADNMAETVAKEMPTETEIQACTWLPNDELDVYAQEYDRTGFQGGLNWYRSRASPTLNEDKSIFAGRAIEVPACFIAGVSDWGIHQSPGALKNMQYAGCSDFRGLHLLDGAGHWVQQEKPNAVVECLLAFLNGHGVV